MSLTSTLTALTRPVAGVAVLPVRLAGRALGAATALLPGGTPTEPDVVPPTDAAPVEPVEPAAPAKPAAAAKPAKAAKAAKPAATAAKVQGDPVVPAKRTPAKKKPVTKVPAPEAASPAPEPAAEPAPVTAIDADVHPEQVDVTPADIADQVGTGLPPSDGS